MDMLLHNAKIEGSKQKVNVTVRSVYDIICTRTSSE
jgi:hypothetical protein